MCILCIGSPIIAPTLSTGIWPDRRGAGRAIYSLVYLSICAGPHAEDVYRFGSPESLGDETCRGAECFRPRYDVLSTVTRCGPYGRASSLPGAPSGTNMCIYLVPGTGLCIARYYFVCAVNLLYPPVALGPTYRARKRRRAALCAHVMRRPTSVKQCQNA